MIARNGHGDNGTDVGSPHTNGCLQVIRIPAYCVSRLFVPPKIMSNKDLALRLPALALLEAEH
jgi:hypothetical protein